MSINSDFHMHSSFSTDSDAEMKAMVEGAISQGLQRICFTEHQDHDYPYNSEFPEGSWMLNIDSYLYELLMMREEYRGKISINFGIEIGLQPSCVRKNYITSTSQDFDFIIASVHVVNGWDTYAHQYFEGKSDREAMEEYFKYQLDNIQMFNNFDVLGHMDYIVRTVPGGEAAYSWLDYQDYIDAILKHIIAKEKGIEINTSALKKGFSNPNPHRDIIKRYKELGGEIITVGSDAHEPGHIAAKFDVAAEILKDCGFNYITVFEKRMANFERI